MSKKSRRRNKKILGVLGALGAAALLGRRGKGAVSTVGQPVGVDRMSTNTPPIHGTDHIPVAPTKVVTAPIKKPVVNNTGSNFQTRFKAKGDDGVWRGPGEIMNQRKLTAGNQIPPSMRGGAETAQGFVRKVPVGQRTRGGRSGVKYGWTTEPYKKGGRVKLAKRGLGRAYTKSKK